MFFLSSVTSTTLPKFKVAKKQKIKEILSLLHFICFFPSFFKRIV